MLLRSSTNKKHHQLCNNHKLMSIVDNRQKVIVISFQFVQVLYFGLFKSRKLKFGCLCKLNQKLVADLTLKKRML